MSTPEQRRKIEEQEEDSERFWKTPNTLDAEGEQGLAEARREPQPEDLTE
jgi:hypothetical protein